MGIPSYAARAALRGAANANRQNAAKPRAPRPKGMVSFTQAMTPEGKAEFREAMRARSRPRATAAVAVPPSRDLRAQETGVANRGAAPAAYAPKEKIDGAALLTHTRQFLNRYAVFPSESALTAVTLWVAASHARDASGVLIWREFPRLGMLSSEPGSGKSRVLELLAMLCPAVPGIESEPSEPAVALAIGKEHVTLILDEADVLFGTGTRKSAIRAIINAGYKRGGTWSRVRKGKVERIPVFGALALAGLDVMEKGTGSALEALLQRFIIIRMKKAVGCAPGKPREVIGNHPKTGEPLTGEDFAARLKEKLETWAAQERDVLAKLTPEMPPGVELRQEELWIALLAVAQQAGPQWQETAWEACTDMSLYGGTPDTTQEDMDLLADLSSGWE